MRKQVIAEMKKDGEREGKREEGREKERFQDSLVLKSIKIVCMLKLNVIFLEKKKMKTGHIFYIWFFLVALLFTFCSILLKILTFQVVNFITLFLWLKKCRTTLHLLQYPSQDLDISGCQFHHIIFMAQKRSDHFIFKRPFK